MPPYLEIAVNLPQVSGVFHYHIPPALEGQVGPGHLVVAPFGKQIVQGVVLTGVERPAVAETRPISGLLDDLPALTLAQIALARHLAETTLSPLAACVALMLPPGLSQQADTQFTLVRPPAGSDELTDLQRRLADLLAARGPLRGRQIDRAIPRTNWRASIKGLVFRGLIASRPVLPPPAVRPKQVRTARLALPPAEAVARPGKLGHTPATQARREAMLRALLAAGEPVEAAWLYAESGGSLSDLQKLAELGLVHLGEAESWRDPLEAISFVAGPAPTLTADQQAVWGPVQAAVAAAARGEAVRPFLLHGVTGSGKTEVYLRAVAETLRLGRQAIVLVPEIALTPQTVRRFLARFPGEVGLVHSGLSAGERYDTWRRARAGELGVIVGPRSALFTPVPRLGLIVVDECHDNAYYQTEAPFYHAREAAVAYAGLAGAVCLLGSATPGVESLFRAEQHAWVRLRLPARILAHKEALQAHRVRFPQAVSRYQPVSAEAEMAALPPVRLVDMRQELKAGNRSIFSRALQTALAETLARGEQAILFLNRRGTATYVFCRDCGHALKCPRCPDLALTYHRPENQLACHHCGYTRKLPAKCPACGSARIRHYGTGTERVESEVAALFPQARMLRWDWETTRKKGAHEAILRQFASHEADVLVGTQMLAKGLDLPLVTLVGVVLAEVGLNLPDFRAGERTFQVLSQVAGRAGRSPLGGEVLVQTFVPEHYVLQAVARYDEDGLYRRELAYRKELGYPPFTRLVRLEVRHREAAVAEAEAVALAGQLRDRIRAEGRRQTELVGPAPCFFARVDGLYRWQIIVRGPDPASLLRDSKLAGWRVEVNPQSLL